MPFSASEQYQAVVIQISGKFLGSIEGPAFKTEVERLRDAGKKRIVIDLSKADFLDSSGIGALIGALTTMRKADGDVKLSGMKDRVKNLFLLTRLLGPVFDDYDTIEEAVASFA